MEIKTKEEILEELNKDAYLWDDNVTVDVTLKDGEFIEILADYQCPRCTNPIVTGNEMLFQSIDENVKGIKITCKICEQRYFLHSQLNAF